MKESKIKYTTKWENRPKIPKKEIGEIFPPLLDQALTLGLSLKEIRFTAEYITNGFNAGKAWFYAVDNKSTKQSTCYTKGCLLLKKEKIKKIIALFMQDFLEEKKGKLERQLVGRLTKMAFYDPSMFITPEGEPAFKDWEQIPEDYRCCVDGIKKSIHRLKDACDRETIEITLIDRKWAMKELLNYLSLAGLKIDLDLGLDESAKDIFQQVFQQGKQMHGNGRKAHERKLGVDSEPLVDKYKTQD